MNNTRNFEDFGEIEIKEAGKLLTAYSQATPDWMSRGVAVEFNSMSGCVFLIDEDYNIGMMNEDEELEQWHNCPECGAEGFIDEMKEGNECCIIYLKEMGLIDEEDE